MKIICLKVSRGAIFINIIIIELKKYPKLISFELKKKIDQELQALLQNQNVNEIKFNSIKSIK
jgi:hypothetical protein